MTFELRQETLETVGEQAYLEGKYSELCTELNDMLALMTVDMKGALVSMLEVSIREDLEKFEEDLPF
jgi:hypothetical protein